MTDYTQMLGQMKDIQATIEEMQQKVAQLQATGESGAGLVKATVNGKKQVVHIEIDPSIIRVEEQQMLQDLIVAAVNIAMQHIGKKIGELVQARTAGMLNHLPLDLLL
jgi:DNA-binding YbaB/EbfC family protein